MIFLPTDVAFHFLTLVCTLSSKMTEIATVVAFYGRVKILKISRSLLRQLYEVFISLRITIYFLPLIFFEVHIALEGPSRHDKIRVVPCVKTTDCVVRCFTVCA